MLESIFIMLIVLGIILLIAAYEWGDPVISLIDSVIWFVCAIGALQIEIPYQYITSGTVTTTTQNISIPALGYFFTMLGVVMFLSFSALALETLAVKRRRR